MKRIAFGLAAVFGVVAAPLGAQWQSMPAPNNDGVPYWDNVSKDGANCNVGFVLTGVAGNADNPCNNQRPSTWLPYVGDAPTAYWGAAGGGSSTFLITPGTYTFSLLDGTGNDGGDIAGANQPWGYFTFDGFGGRDRVDVNAGIPGELTFTGLWGMWVQLYDTGAFAYSDLDPQFSAFMTATSTLVFGFEDVSMRGGSDRDYQDDFIQLSWTEGGGPEEVIPEPATMGLLATGLAGMAAASRRRRNQKK